MTLTMDQSLEASLERCCRLCAEEQDVTIMIFSEEAEAMLLQNKLNKYLLIEVDEDDRLPKNICINCCTKLQTVCEFIDTAHKAQEILQNRSLMIDQIATTRCFQYSTSTSTMVKTEPPDDDQKFTEMEISVDPMMILQNEDMQSPDGDDFGGDNAEDVTHLHGVDGDDVTIKLIKRGTTTSTESDDRRRLKHFPCKSCERKFCTELALQNHAWTHLHEEKYTKQVSSDSEPEEKKPFLCVTCKRRFCTELALKNHSWTHTHEARYDKQYLCNSCDEGFDLKSDLINHLKEHRESGFCNICGRTFRTENNLKAHMAVHLSSAKSYTCKVCGRSYNTLSNLKTHSVTHSNERPYQCHMCKKSFKRKQDLKFHLNQHTGAKPYKCPFCDKTFASSGNCYSHRSRMHPGRNVEKKIRRVNASPSQENQALKPKPVISKLPFPNVKGVFKYYCQICGHSFVKRDNYTYHMYQHTGEKPFTCSICPEKFVTRRGLLLHHNKEHPAKVRPLALLSKNALLK